jgi:SWIM zinc finger
VCRSMDYYAEISKNGLRWVMNLEEHTCNCRGWQVKGILCVHAAAFIATIRNVRWKNYADSCFTVVRFKAAYSIGIPPMLS